ncbi:elongation factor P maturation arginine rhamnosyltransferase EarP [Bordetella petrii]|uniref:elongation factor P maturation arginine rhamnosyltransferase EarP n=1 Tax=Bordetella petrii TaxID=94624 RepID=UPI001A96AE6A|nr:elongation factor P maturation arginine rhamnosyltransferase EarP [Bordetella petrii]MBO1112396.1 elongation factor P maturation arginine rhamnosyltransferase EarP [Bordetella petrii]
MRADIFCRVIDNYGDIGVCWRLARRLAQGRGWQVRLWVDDLRAFARIQPGIAADAGLQRHTGIDIVHWTSSPPPLEPGDVAIEAFACDPPAAFVQAMRARPPVWINLEYLSAEPWVESCHGLPSRRADGLVKHFFFPGFTAATGGLLREPGLSAERDAFQAERPRQEAFLRGLGLDDAALAHWRAGARLANLFCYPHAPLAALARALARDTRPTLLLAPEGTAPGLEDAGGGALRIARVPFMPQPDFDRLLWCADLNFVRGEDSFVRAAWAARPLVWQIYPQADDAHLDKLEAWLGRYPCPPQAQALIRAWNAPDGAAQAVAAALPAALAAQPWSDWQAAARAWDASQAARPDLGDALADFCAELARKR